ncbi:MAG: YcxB family protein [Fluviicola sp.]
MSSTFNVTFTHDENDYLDQQLYVATQSKQIVQRRQRGKLLIPVFSLVMIGIQFYQKQYIQTLYFLGIAIAWFFLYPLWEKRHYLKFYKKFISDNFKDRFHKETSVEFKANSLVAKDDTTSGEINYSEIDKIIEIQSSYYIKLKSSAYLIFPKDKTKDMNTLHEAFTFLKEKHAIPFSSEINWIWK